MTDGASTGSFDQFPRFTPPLCASWRKAWAPCPWTCSVTRRKWGTASGRHAAALLGIWYAVVGCTAAWPQMTAPTPPRARSAR